jgi:hypothetical protein
VNRLPPIEPGLRGSIRDSVGTGAPPVWPVAWMTVIAAALLGLSMPAIVAPALIAGLVLSYLVTGRPRMPRPRAFYTFLLFVPFIFWWRYGMEQITHIYVPIALLYVMAFYVLSLAAHHILAHRHGGSLDHALGCAVLALGVAGAGNRRLLWIYGPLLAVFAALMLIHLRRQLVHRGSPARRQRVVFPWYIAALAGVLALAAVLETLVVHRIPEAGQWVMNRLLTNPKTPTLGFRAPRLGSVSELWGSAHEREQIMLRVFAPRMDDPYLRGGAYSRYVTDEHGGRWTNNEPRRLDELQPGGSHLGRHVFNTTAHSSGQWSAVIFSNPEISDAFFVPLGTHEIASFTEKAYVEAGQTLRPEGYGAGGGYAVAVPAVNRLGPPVEDDLEVPARILPFIRAYAEQALSPDMTATAKVRRLEAWFPEQGFEYKIGIDIQEQYDDPRRDPVLQFLEIRKGHCEYFASAATLMLRSAGVPARYVTGFLADEPGMGGNLWIARRKHAHAWVEAWIEEQGWTRVEPTPPDAMPHVAAAYGAQRWFDWLAAQWERFVQFTLYGGLTGLLGAAWDALMGLPQKVPPWGWALALMAGLAWIFREPLLARWRRGRGEVVCERVLRLRQKLAEAEAALRRYGLHRPPGRTVGAYLRSVRSAPQLPAAVRARVLPLLDEYVRERFRRE